MDLVLPRPIEAEQAALGMCLVHGICPTLPPDAWSRHEHSLIATAMQALESAQEPITMITVHARIRGKTDIGASYLAQLMEVASSPAAYEHYLRQIKSAADARNVIMACAQVAARSEEFGRQPIGEWLPTIQQAIDQVGRYGGTSDPEQIGAVAKRVIMDLEQRRLMRDSMLGLPTGLIDLDRATSGMCPSDLIIIAGRPGMGKTALGTQIAAFVAGLGKRVLVVSMEMSREQIVMRVLAQRAGVDLRLLRTGMLDDREFARVVTMAGGLPDLDIHIDDAAELTEIDISHRARRIQPDLVIVDYLTLCRPAHRETRRDLEVGNISRAMKAMAKQLKIPVVLLSQLNRSLESRQDKRPLCSDLRDSGAIEQDADVILLLYRDEVYDAQSRDSGTAEIIVAKQRNGPTGMTRVQFEARSALFRNLSMERRYAK